MKHPLSVAFLVSCGLSMNGMSEIVFETSLSGPNNPSTPDDEVTFAADASDEDLLHGIQGTGGQWNANGSSPDGLNDGLPGGDFDDVGLLALNGQTWARDGDGVSVRDFELGTGDGGLGYTITSVQSIASWSGAGFSNQKFEIYLRLVGAADFTLLTTVDYQPFPVSSTSNGGSSKVVITDDTGPLASGVEAIRFSILDTMSFSNGGAVFSEIDVFGQETGASGSPVLSISKNPGTPSAFDFLWNSRPEKIYDLVSSTDLSTPPSTWAVWEGHENIDADPGATNQLTSVVSEDSKRFFAIREKDAPVNPGN